MDIKPFDICRAQTPPKRSLGGVSETYVVIVDFMVY